MRKYPTMFDVARVDRELWEILRAFQSLAQISAPRRDTCSNHAAGEHFAQHMPSIRPRKRGTNEKKKSLNTFNRGNRKYIPKICG